MKKGSLRTSFVKGKIYKWIVDEKEIRIYDDTKKMHRIKKSEMYSTIDYGGYIDHGDDYGSIKPAMIRIWIKNNILKNLS